MSNAIKRVRIIYFSGTGGTKRIAVAFEKELKGRNLDVSVTNLRESQKEREDAHSEQNAGYMDLNILIYPVYAMDAPKPVYDLIGSVHGSEAGEKIAVLSVSGGGEMWPNKGCRNSCCKVLTGKGFQVVYDRMMCMPAYVLVEYNDHLVMRLLGVIPKKAAQIVDELLEGKVRRTRFRKGLILNWVSKSERDNVGKFAQRFRSSDDCTGMRLVCPKLSHVKYRYPGTFFKAVLLRPVHHLHTLRVRLPCPCNQGRRFVLR